MKFKYKLLDAIKRHGQRRGKASHSMAKLARWYLTGYENIDFNPNYNGELKLIKKLCELRPRIVFDVGANSGSWGREFLLHSSANVHFFEIAESTFSILERNIASDRAWLNNFGLSNESGEVQFLSYPENSEISSLIQAQAIHGLEPKSLRAKVSVGSEYMLEHGINEIDILKIDVEGAENLVLEGFLEQLKCSSIRMIQFEYGMANIYSRFLLRDYYDLFESIGYRVGKIFPHGVEWKTYDPRDEDFQGPNFVACQRHDQQMIGALAKF